MATVAPLGISETACSGDLTILFIEVLSPPSLFRSRRPHRLVVTERDRGPRPARRRLGQTQHRTQVAQPADRGLAGDRPPLELFRRELLRHILELALRHLTAADQPAARLRERDSHEPAAALARAARE